MRKPFGTAVVVVLLSIGCRDAPSAPQRLSGLYVLQSINGNSLPATAAQGSGQQYVVLADSLAFDPGGQVKRSLAVRRITTTPPLRDTIYSQTFVLSYSVEGNTLTIGPQQSCGPAAICLGSDQGTIDATNLRVIARMLWPGDPEFVFTRRE